MLDLTIMVQTRREEMDRAMKQLEKRNKRQG